MPGTLHDSSRLSFEVVFDDVAYAYETVHAIVVVCIPHIRPYSCYRRAPVASLSSARWNKETPSALFGLGNADAQFGLGNADAQDAGDIGADAR